MQPLTGPIPGENYTSDTKNYPWHRPPEYTDIDKAIDGIAKKLLAPESALGIITMLEMKVDIATMTSIFLMSGMGAGKWTPDLMLLLAGPVSHIFVLMAEGFEIPYDLGIEDKAPKATSAFLKAVQADAKKIQVVSDAIDVTPIKEAAAAQSRSGLMGMAAQSPAEEINEAPETTEEENQEGMM
jgi:hypothetical protein